MNQDLDPGSPEWWLHRLMGQLQLDMPRMVLMERYYRGNHPLPYVPRKLKDEFRTMLARSQSNFMRVVVDAPAERIKLQGFRPADSEQVSSEAWDLWTAAGMDVDLNLAVTDSMVDGRSYLLADENGVQVLDPKMTIVEFDPHRRARRRAGLHVFPDEFDSRKINAAVFVAEPSGIVRYNFTSRKQLRRSPDWPQSWEPAYPIDDTEVRRTDLQLREDNAAESVSDWYFSQWTPHPERFAEPLTQIQAVPIVPIVNRPSTSKVPDGESELDDIYLTQDRINEMLFNRALAAWTTAYRQKWATGLDIPVDETGKPREPFQAAIDRLWVSEDKETRFGEFGATDLKPYIESVEQDIAHLAVQTRTPRHYFLVSGQAPSGDSIKSAEAGLVAKVIEKEAAIGAAASEAVTLAMQVAGTDVQDRLQAVFGDPEFRTMGELTDAVMKEYGAGLIPRVVALERLQYSPTEIARIERLLMSEAVLSDARAALTEVESPANPEPELT